MPEDRAVVPKLTAAGCPQMFFFWAHLGAAIQNGGTWESWEEDAMKEGNHRFGKFDHKFGNHCDRGRQGETH